LLNSDLISLNSALLIVIGRNCLNRYGVMNLLLNEFGK
jgi:hypothetical protein